MHTTHVNNRFWLLLALLLLPVLSIWAESLENIKKKEFNETFKAGTKDFLQIDNRYGNITVTHWTKNEVEIKVVVESRANSDNRAQEGLDRVQIKLNKTGNTISGITSLSSQSGWNNNNNRLTINYHISMPSALTANFSQKYGNITLPDKTEGKNTLEVKYGNIKAGNFTSPLVIEGGYSNISIEDVENIRMDLSYCSGVSIGNGKEIRLDSKYSNVTAKKIGNLSVNKKYGNLSVKSADQVSIDVKYSEVNIDRVTNELQVSALDYSTLNVKELSSNFKKVYVEARYGNFNVSISSNAGFKVSAERMKYGNVDIKGFNITHSNVENKVNYYYQINGGGNNTIEFNGNSYSNIKVRTL